VFQVSSYLIEWYGGAHPAEEPQRLAARINQIFEEEGIGYRWIDGRLVRFDGEVTHELAVVPALTALATGRFGAAQAEFDVTAAVITFMVTSGAAGDAPASA
jgi:hypothetical protein